MIWDGRSLLCIYHTHATISRGYNYFFQVLVRLQFKFCDCLLNELQKIVRPLFESGYKMCAASSRARTVIYVFRNPRIQDLQWCITLDSMMILKFWFFALHPPALINWWKFAKRQTYLTESTFGLTGYYFWLQSMMMMMIIIVFNLHSNSIATWHLACHGTSRAFVSPANHCLPFVLVSIF